MTRKNAHKNHARRLQDADPRLGYQQALAAVRSHPDPAALVDGAETLARVTDGAVTELLNGVEGWDGPVPTRDSLHDVCDANVFVGDALAAEIGREPETGDPDDAALFNDAFDRLLADPRVDTGADTSTVLDFYRRKWDDDPEWAADVDDVPRPPVPAEPVSGAAARSRASTADGEPLVPGLVVATRSGPLTMYRVSSLYDDGFTGQLVYPVPPRTTVHRFGYDDAETTFRAADEREFSRYEKAWDLPGM